MTNKVQYDIISIMLTTYVEAGEMAKEWVITQMGDLLACIDEVAQQSTIKISSLEQNVGISAGLISRWRKDNSIPKIDSVLKLLENLDLELVVKEKGSEEEKTNLAFSNQQIAKPQLGLLERKMNQKLDSSLQNDTSKWIGQLLLSEEIPEADKRMINKMLTFLLLMEELG